MTYLNKIKWKILTIFLFDSDHKGLTLKSNQRYQLINSQSTSWLGHLITAVFKDHIRKVAGSSFKTRHFSSLQKILQDLIPYWSLSHHESWPLVILIDSVTKCLLVTQTLLSIPNPDESSCIWFWLMPDGLLTELHTPNSKPRLYHWPILWAITLVHLLISRFKGMSALLTHTCKNTPGDRWHQLKPILGHLSLRGEEVSETTGDLLKAHITVITVYCHVRSF